LGLGLAAAIGALFITIPRSLLALFGMTDPVVVGLGVQLLGFLSVSGLFVTVALTYTGGLQGTGDTRSPPYISIASEIVLPLALRGGAASVCESRAVRESDGGGMPWPGFEPGRLAALPPQDSVSTSSTTRAWPAKLGRRWMRIKPKRLSLRPWNCGSRSRSVP